MHLLRGCLRVVLPGFILLDAPRFLQGVSLECCVYRENFSLARPRHRRCRHSSPQYACNMVRVLFFTFLFPLLWCFAFDGSGIDLQSVRVQNSIILCFVRIVFSTDALYDRNMNISSLLCTTTKATRDVPLYTGRVVHRRFLHARNSKKKTEAILI